MPVRTQQNLREHNLTLQPAQHLDKDSARLRSHPGAASAVPHLRISRAPGIVSRQSLAGFPRPRLLCRRSAARRASWRNPKSTPLFPPVVLPAPASAVCMNSTVLQLIHAARFVARRSLPPRAYATPTRICQRRRRNDRAPIRRPASQFRIDQASIISFVQHVVAITAAARRGFGGTGLSHGIAGRRQQARRMCGPTHRRAVGGQNRSDPPRKSRHPDGCAGLHLSAGRVRRPAAVAAACEPLPATATFAASALWATSQRGHQQDR